VKRATWVFAVGWFLAGTQVFAGELKSNPQTSLLVGIDLGAGLDLDSAARSPADWRGENTEAYSLSSFLFGFHCGYRFNEMIGVEGGWHDQTHWTHDGYYLHKVHYNVNLGGATYQFGHVALRLAWPTGTRQTPVFKIGPALGSFSYARASPGAIEENSAFVLGGLTSLSLEHELTQGIVAALEFAYLPIYRFGMDEVLRIWIDYDYDGYETDNDTLIDTKDFTEGRLVHLMWVLVTVQFEWTFR
jgi:hypothetical protein